jgi:hypothetical protein
MKKFQEFLREKQYLQNVSAHTLRWYRFALNWLPSENPNAVDLKLMVVKMREAGLKATGCNERCHSCDQLLLALGQCRRRQVQRWL